MRQFITGLLTVGLIVFGAREWESLAADAAPSATPAPAGEAAPAPGATPPSSAGAASPASAGGTMSPIDRVASTPKGQLKNPYMDYAGMADEGHKKFMSSGCNGCHGGGGGGGMCPPITNDIWIYGRDDDTLFRLITLGTDELHKQGYVRHGSEAVVGPMPAFGQILKSDDDLWKIISWIRAVNPNSLIPPKSYAPPPG